MAVQSEKLELQQPTCSDRSLEESNHIGRLNEPGFDGYKPQEGERPRAKAIAFPPSPSYLDCHTEVLPIGWGRGGASSLSVSFQEITSHPARNVTFS